MFTGKAAAQTVDEAVQCIMILGNHFIPFFYGHIHLQCIDMDIAVADVGRDRRCDVVLLFDFRQFRHEVGNLVYGYDDIFCQEDEAVIAGRFAVAITGIPDAFVGNQRFGGMIVLTDFIGRGNAVIEVILIIGINGDDDVIAVFFGVRQIHFQEPFGTLDGVGIEEFDCRRLHARFLQLVRYGQGVVDIFENADQVEMEGGDGTQFQTDFRDDAESSFTSADEFFQGIAGRVLLEPFTYAGNFTGRCDDFQPVYLVTGRAVFDDAAAAGIGGDVATDFTGRFGAGIAGIIEASFFGCSLYGRRDGAGFGNHVQGIFIDFDDFIHLF